MADAEGLNPSVPQGTCGFETHPGHRFLGLLAPASGSNRAQTGFEFQSPIIDSVLVELLWSIA